MSLRGTGQGGSIQRLIEGVQVLGSAGFLSPRFLSSLGPAARKYGSTAAAGFHAAASRSPKQIALIDDDGELTFEEVERDSNAIAHELRKAGVHAGEAVGLFARNHRGFVLAQVALDKLGANTLLLNTGFAARQLREVCEREGTRVILYDEEFRSIVEGGASDLTRFVTHGGGRRERRRPSASSPSRGDTTPPSRRRPSRAAPRS